MRIVVFIIAFLDCTCLAKAQTNLVPNGDFEEKDNCSSAYLGGINNWLPCGSPDYFHNCATNPAYQIPNNNYGFQWPLSGNSFVGIGLYQPDTDYREYLKIKLKKKLEIGCIYYIKFFYSNAEKSSHISNSIGVLFDFTDVNCSDASHNRINKIPQLNVPFGAQVDTNTTDWLLYEGVFIAKDTSTWMYIGNFYPNELTNLVNYSDPIYQRAYIYIDDVKLHNLCEDTLLLKYLVIKPQLPTGITVNADGKNDKLRLMNPTFFNSLKLNLYDRWGHLLYSTNDVNFAWDGTLQGSRVPIGVYQWQAVYTTIYDNKEQYATGNVTVLY